MTIAEELKNRNDCRYRLAGVLVAVDGDGLTVPVSSTRWAQDSGLVVVFADGSEVTADRCHLRSPWPIACCRPKRRNEWNSKGKKWIV